MNTVLWIILVFVALWVVFMEALTLPQTNGERIG